MLEVSIFEKIHLMLDVKIKTLLISVRISKGNARKCRAAGLMKKVQFYSFST